MGASEAHGGRSGFYAAMAALALGAALAGSAAIFLTGQTSALREPFAAYGALAAVWCALLFWMTREQRVRRRADIGFAAAAFAVVMAYALPRCGVATVAAAQGAVSPFLSIVVATFLFLACAAAALFNQDRGDAYARFMLLAGAALVWPLAMRLSLDLLDGFGFAARLAPFAADLAVLAAIIRDGMVLKPVHPVYGRMGLIVVALHALEAAAYDSTPWRAAASAVYSVFTG
ncbi:MAG: hypothetical protein KAH44_19430 [Oricola sp.]|jgi:uncharacterized membrane protein|nr:hypothetical protein [Oricola sp.]